MIWNIAVWRVHRQILPSYVFLFEWYFVVKEKSWSKYIYHAFLNFVKTYELPVYAIVCITTDRVPAMTGNQVPLFHYVELMMTFHHYSHSMASFMNKFYVQKHTKYKRNYEHRQFHPCPKLATTDFSTII